LDEGRLFFKTDAQSQADYTMRGMGPFTYEMKGRVLDDELSRSARTCWKTGRIGGLGRTARFPNRRWQQEVSKIVPAKIAFRASPQKTHHPPRL